MSADRRDTPAGTWPLLISGGQFLLVVPAILLGEVVPVWLAVAGAFLFLLVAVAAVVWSYRTYLSVQSTPSRGVPMAGIIVGMIVVIIAGLVMVPAAF